MKRARRIAVLVAIIGLVAVVPAVTQSQWNMELPAVVGLVEGGFLFTIAPPTFQGCSAGAVINALPGMPNLDLWSILVVADADAPLINLHWVVTPQGAQNIRWQTDAWIRVFPLGQGDLDDYQTNPCGFYRTHEFVAEGLGRWDYHSADDGLVGPGVNSWGFTLHAESHQQRVLPARSGPETDLDPEVGRKVADGLDGRAEHGVERPDADLPIGSNGGLPTRAASRAP